METKSGDNGHKHLIGITRIGEDAPVGGQAMALETVQTILAQRAARLAQAPEQETEGERIRLVVVRLGSEVYALDTQFVFDVWSAGQITFVPGVPKWVLGVVNRRGRILSVVDLREFLGLDKAKVDRKKDDNGWDDNAAGQIPYLILLQIPAMEVVLRVDDVLGVEALLNGRITDLADTVRGIPQEYVRGVSELDNEREKLLVVILDVRALLCDERLIVHQEIV
ncbi:MAG: chemotaxis protein CheW [Anaerolineae bacterium]|nr:chemotaxis protein CheW [Anaerolineae bacterium]